MSAVECETTCSPMNDQAVPNLEVRVLQIEDLDPTFIADWENLATHALEPDYFLAPSFVLPAMRILTPHCRPRFFAVYCRETKKLRGLGIFSACPPSTHMPLPYLSSYRCPHTFKDGLLLDSDHARPAAEKLLRFLARNVSSVFGIEFRQLCASSEQGKMLFEIASRLRLKWCETERYERGALYPQLVNSETYLNDSLSYKRRKTVRRCLRQLVQLGYLDLLIHPSERLTARVVDTFLRLENEGWKGTAGSSLQANENNRRFFLEIVETARKRGEVVFTEMTLNGEPIASTCSFASGDAAFAFKVGWAIRFERFSPGVVHEVLFAQAATKIFPNARFIDSCTEDDSFIEKLWPNRICIVSGMFMTTRLSRVCRFAMNGLRRVKHSLKRA